ncbi:hypothetical protein N9873_04100 [Akkermansiaceae bacterium]|nr:hypothetical protein [Akkermansiaceae bacterium]MDB4273394.1 hypothetical protein [Akkermansiaceae bacterium]MDB4668242.1 hypothetical protein [Akkermansiaceae bacterium]
MDKSPSFSKLLSMKLAPFPSPRALVRQWEKGEIKREELHALIAQHQAAILAEAEEERANPIAAYLDRLSNKRMAKKLINQHGEASLRELCLGLSELPEFLPAAFLWNADHWDLPFHCFIRHQKEPVFRIREVFLRQGRAMMLIEHGSAKKRETTRERITFERHWRGEMKVVSREEV